MGSTCNTRRAGRPYSLMADSSAAQSRAALHRSQHAFVVMTSEHTRQICALSTHLGDRCLIVPSVEIVLFPGLQHGEQTMCRHSTCATPPRHQRLVGVPCETSLLGHARCTTTRAACRPRHGSVLPPTLSVVTTYNHSPLRHSHTSWLRGRARLLSFTTPEISPRNPLASFRPPAARHPPRPRQGQDDPTLLPFSSCPPRIFPPPPCSSLVMQKMLRPHSPTVSS